MNLNLENIKRGISLMKTVNFNTDCNKGPIMLEVATTSACTHKCYFCAEHSNLIPVEHTSFKMPDEMLWKLLSDIKKLKIEEVRLAGNGEPTADPRLTPIVDFLHQAGVKVLIVTNGTLVERLPDSTFSKLHKITISINSFNNVTHQVIHDYKGATQLPKIMKNLDRLAKIPGVKKKIQINYVMTTDNYAEFSEVLDYVEKNDIFVAIRPVYVGYKEIASKKLEFGHINKVLSEIEERFTQGNLSNNLLKTLEYARQSFTSDASTFQERNELLPCFAGLYGGYIESNGDYRISTYCDGKPMGNIKHSGFIGLWKDNQLQSKLYSGVIMNETRRPLFKNCNNCLEGENYSRQFYSVFSKIPLQMQLIRNKHKEKVSKVKSFLS
ncbi:MAG: radical SAM protein [Bacteriovoracaceae bacterium]|nr:radical SAM protein [Bacteriovoracaceae bacterium]